MKATEVNLEKSGYNFSCSTYLARSHYKLLMRLGQVFPNTKAQARYFCQNQINLNVLNKEDVDLVEGILNKYGFEGKYKYTKSKSWVRLLNMTDLHKALKLHFNL